MILRDLKTLLTEYPDRPFRLCLPHGENVPLSFHVTEVGYVQKKFIDCGGRIHQNESCLLQAWVGSDPDHRLATGKLAAILGKASTLLPHHDLPVEIEYESTLLSQYTVDDAVIGESVVLQLASKHTDCLAKDVCLPPSTAQSSCGCGPGCC